MTYIENRKHTFAIADLGQFDLDEDRSITPSIKMALEVEGIEADVDGEEHNGSIFYVHTRSPRDVVRQALENQDIHLDE